MSQSDAWKSELGRIARVASSGYPVDEDHKVFAHPRDQERLKEFARMASIPSDLDKAKEEFIQVLVSNQYSLKAAQKVWQIFGKYKGIAT